MNPQTEMQPRAVPPDGMFERLVGVATPDREPDFTITSYGKNDALHVVLGFRQVNEMDRGREIEGVVAVEAVNARNSRTGKFALTVGLMLQKAGVEVLGEPPQFISVPNPDRTIIYLEPNEKFPDSTSILAECRRLFNYLSRGVESPVSIPIRPDIHEATGRRVVAPADARYDLPTGKMVSAEERSAATMKLISLPKVGEMVDSVKGDPEFIQAGWGGRVWSQVQVSAYRALKEVASRQKSAAVSLGSFLDEIDNVSSVPKMTLTQRNVVMVAFSELANQVERAGRA